MRILPTAALYLAGAALAQTPESGFLKNSSFEDVPALLLSNDKIELTVLTNGGALANLILRDDAEKLSPFWNPSGTLEKPGVSIQARLWAFRLRGRLRPRFARRERSGTLRAWRGAYSRLDTKSARKEGAAAVLTQTVKLPILQEIFTRTLRMVDGETVVYVESELESLLGFDRPVNWGEHATIGSPFLEAAVTVVDMPAARAQTRRDTFALPGRLARGEDFTWPMAPLADGRKVDVRAAPPTGDTIDHTTCLMDPSRKLVYVTALNPSKRLILGYVFRREDYPWVQSWENYPADKRMARGLEFATQPYDVPRRQTVETHTMFDTPTYRWLPAKSKIESRYLLFYARAPEGFLRVDDVRLEGGKLVIEDRQAGKRITLNASRPI